MALKSSDLKTRLQVEIPMEPASYKFLMESIVDPVQKKCMLAAIRKYNTRCEKAYKELIDDLKKCQLKKKL